MFSPTITACEWSNTFRSGYNSIVQPRTSNKQLHKQVKLNNIVNRVPVSFSESFTCVLLFEKNVAWLWAHIFWDLAAKLNLFLIFFLISVVALQKWADYAGFVSMNTL